MDTRTIERKRQNLDRFGGTLIVERSGLCPECGLRVSDLNIAHGPLGGNLCCGHPSRGWRYRSVVVLVGMTYPASLFPRVAATLEEAEAHARLERRSVVIKLEPAETID